MWTDVSGDGIVDWTDSSDNILFHLNPRHWEASPVVVLNTRMHGKWGREERIAKPASKPPHHIHVHLTEAGFQARCEQFRCRFVRFPVF